MQFKENAFGSWDTGLWLLVMLAFNLQALAGQTVGETPVAPAASVQIKELHPDDAIHFSVPSPVAFASKIKCGPDGDIYALYSNNSYVEVWRNPIRRISLSSRQITEYSIPTISGYESLSRASFDVDTNGTLYALLQASPRSGSDSDTKYVSLIVKYKEDGSIDSYYPLAELPDKKVHPTSLTMFADGNSLVSGTIREKDAPASSLGVFSAIFNQTGAYRAPVTLVKPATSTESGSMSSKDPAATPERRDSISLASSLLTFGSPDGNIYVLQSAHLDVVSHGGSIEREIDLVPPSKDLSPIQMAAAGVGYLFAFYDHVSTGTAGESTERRSMITVANLQTGGITATYRMSPVETDFAVAACAVSVNDFVFLSSDQQNNLEVVHYRPK
jgi:hypothetical protein